MVKAYGKFYHEREKESSWDSPEPCSGTYVENKNSITLYDIAGNKIGNLGKASIEMWKTNPKANLNQFGKKI